MGTTLTGKNISASYFGLLKSTDNLAIGGTKKIITDGAGNNLPFGISTSSFTFNAGAVDVPTLSIGNIDDGFYQPTDESVGVTIAGSEIARFNGTGLGIGVSPTSTLHVNGDANINNLTVGLGSGSISTNTVFGNNALNNNTSGYMNVAIGVDALRNNTDGDNNIAIGRLALSPNTSGIRNVSLGNQSLTSNTTGSYNVGLGYDGLSGLSSGGYNIGIGYEAGNNITTGTGSIMIGGVTRSSAVTSSNEIVIGYNTTGNGSNTVTIGNSSITTNYFSGDILLGNSENLFWGNTSDVYISGTTVSDNIQLGVGGSTQFTFSQASGLRLHQYGGGTITGTVTQRLGVTSTGQVVEIPIGAGAVDGTGTAGKIVKWSDSDTITDSLLTESTNSVSLADNKELILGNDSDLTIKHSSTGNQNLIKSDTHQLFITSDVGMELADNGGKSYFEATEGGSSRLFFNNSKKIETTNTGVTITGGGTFTGGALTVGNSGTSRFTDTGAFPLQINRGLDVDSVGANGAFLSMGSIKAGSYVDAIRMSGGLAVNGTDGTFTLQTLGSGSYTTALTVDSSQNSNFNASVGIGHTSTPDSALDVRKNDSATTPLLTLRQLGAGDSSINFQTTTSPFGFNMGVDGSDSDSFKIAVGLGDVGTDTALKIDTSKNATFSALVTAVSLNLSDFAQIKVDDAEFYWTNTANTDYWRWKRDASNNFTLDHFNGSSTNNALSFDSSQNATFEGSATIETGISLESGVLVIKNATGDSSGLRIFQDSSDASKIYNNYNGTLQLGVGNTTAITIDSSENTIFTGNVGIGLTSFSNKLAVSGSMLSAGIPLIQFNETSGNARDGVYLNYTGTTNSAVYSLKIADATKTHLAVRGDGNVGINNASPAEKLEVNGNLKFTSNGNFIKMVRNSGSAVIDVMGFESGTDTLIIKGGSSSGTAIKFKDTGGDVMTIHDAKVGINETNPAVKLQISGSGAEELLRLSGQSGFMSFFEGSTRTGFIQSDNSNGFFNIGVEDSNAFRIFMGASERLRLDSSGRLGLKVLSPTTFLDVRGDSTALPATSGTTVSDGTRFRIGSTTASTLSAVLDFGLGTSSRAWIQSTSVGDLSDTKTLLLNPNGGDIGIGHDSPVNSNNYNTLDIRGTSGGQFIMGRTAMDFFLYTTSTSSHLGTSTGQDLVFHTNSSGASNERMRISSGGVIQNATIDSSTTSALRISNNAGGGNFTYGMTIEDDSTNTGFILFAQSDGTTVGTITRSNTSTVYATTSDYRLKENVVELTGALDRISKLKPSRFNFIADAETTVDGFLAHEVQDIVPEAITGEKNATEEYEVTPEVLDDEGNVIEEAVMGTRDVYQGIDQSKLVPLLVASIQELKAEIDKLKKNK